MGITGIVATQHILLATTHIMGERKVNNENLDQPARCIRAACQHRCLFTCDRPRLTLDDPDMGDWTYTYDALGNLTSQTDARSCTTTLVYDVLNRVTNKTYGTSCPATSAVAYTYDAGTYGIGQRTGMTDGSGATSWTYDVRGRLVNETKTISGIPYTTGWTYNSADLVTAITYPDGEVVQNTYLPQMALARVTSSSATYVNDTQYDAAGRIVLRTLGEDIMGADIVDTAYTYYPWDQQGGGRLHTLQSTGLQSLQNLTYTYDDVGNITSIVDTLAGGTQTQSFSYDALNRLVTASAVGGTEGAYAQESYTYSATTGNLASKAGVSYTYDTVHPHAVASLSNGNSYSYDANGNQTTRIINALTYNLAYDAENRLVGVSGATTASYVYDGDGTRVQSVESGVTTTYVNNLYEVADNQPVAVPNGGFESSAWTTQNSTGFPATSFYYGSSGIALPNTGTYAQTISNLANGWIESPAISISGGSTYDVYAYLHGEFDADDSAGQWKIQVLFFNGVFEIPLRTVDYGETIGTSWQYEGGQIVAPTRATTMKVRLVNEMNSGWIAFDDLEVYLIANGSRVGSNLMTDGGFENSTSSWTTQVQAGFPGTAFYRGSSGIAAPRSGSYAYSISNLAYGTLESPDITVSASTSYTVYAYLRGELDAHDSNGSWIMRVKYYTSSGTFLSQTDVSTGTSLTTTWTQKSGTITTPVNTARMRVQFINQTNAGWLAVDDLSVATIGGFSKLIYSWGFDTDGTWTATAQSGFSSTTAFYRGGSGIAAPRTGTSAYAISNLANGMLVSEAMGVAPGTRYTVNTYLRGEIDNLGSAGDWQINACFYRIDNTLSECRVITGSGLSTSWTQVSSTLTSPPDAVTLKLELSGTQFSGWLAWDDASVSLEEQVITKYYYAGGQRVAVRKDGELSYLLGDHLGSASVVTDVDGGLLSETMYKPWGEMRYSGGAVIPTDRLYTGQIAEPILGLYFYNARWYDSSLSRFAQADTVVPLSSQGVQAWDRYAYSNNNPVKYIDPDGHCPLLIGAAIGAFVGAVISGGAYALTNQGESFNWGEFAVAAGGGAIAGALVGSGIGLMVGAVSTATAAVGATMVTTANAVGAVSATSTSLISAGVSAEVTGLSYMAQTPGNFEVSPYVIGSVVSGVVGAYSPGASFGVKVGLNAAGAELIYLATAKEPTLEGMVASGLGGAAFGVVDWGMDALVVPTVLDAIRIYPGPVSHATGATVDAIFSNVGGNIASYYAQKKALEAK